MAGNEDSCLTSDHGKEVATRKALPWWPTPLRATWMPATMMTFTLALIILLFGSAVVILLWHHGHGKVYTLQYNVLLNGRSENCSLEIDSARHSETLRSGSGSDEEVVEIHDFDAGITAVWFKDGASKCYIKPQPKFVIRNRTLHLETDTAGRMGGESTPDPRVSVWLADEAPVVDAGFLSGPAAELCAGRTVHWLRPGPQSRRQRRQDPFAYFRGQEEEEDAAQRYRSPFRREEMEEMLGGEFDPMLDHNGACCAACRRGYQHCRRVCEPLGGFHPWPYYYQGCRVHCGVIMPCSWWVARMLGYV